MTEHIPSDYQPPVSPRHRVTFLLGTLGYAELDQRVMDSLVWEADFVGILGDDELRVSADQLTNNYYVDWIAAGQSAEAATKGTLERTLRLMGSVGINLDAIAIKGAYATADEGLFDRFPEIALADMDDLTEVAHDTTRDAF